MAHVKESTDPLISKVNVYGVYHFQGINEMILKYGKEKIQWNVLNIDRQLHEELLSKIGCKDNVSLIPTPDYDKLSPEEKTINEYKIFFSDEVEVELQRIAKLQKVPIKSGCVPLCKR